MSKAEKTTIDDLIILGRGCPEEIKDGRQTICTAGYSPSHGFIRIYPTRWDSPLQRWNVVKVPVERPLKPRYNGRSESWKIVGSRREWDVLSDKIELVEKYPRKKRPELIAKLIDPCVTNIYDDGRTLGIIRPTILEHYLADQTDMKTHIQLTLDNRFRVKVKDEFPIEPRIKYTCTDCKVKRGFHDQQVIEWEVYEWFRKHPDNCEQVWENMHLDDPDYEVFFFVGNLYLYPTAFVIISVLRFKKDVILPFLAEKEGPLDKFFEN